MSAKYYRDLTVWQQVMELVTSTYKLTDGLPKAEQYGLTTQLRRAAVSIPANIAEGNGRGSRQDYTRFISIALGSLMEFETLLEVAIRVEYLESAACQPVIALATEVGKMLNTMRSKLANPRT